MGQALSRTAVRRLPHKQVHDRAALDAVLDAGRVAHVAVVDETGQPYVLPVAYARDGDRVLFHGSTGSRLFRALAVGAATCFTVTLEDGLVLARSAFESSMHYRSAMVLGRPAPVRGPQRAPALERISEQLMPGRWADIRGPSRRELAATSVLALALEEWSLKVSAGPPADLEDDLDRPAWAGVVPRAATYGPPVAAPDLRHEVAVPAYVASWVTA